MSGARAGMLGNAARASVASGSGILLVVLLVAAGRLLGDEDYGKFSFALALAMIFETVVDFGLQGVTTREVARNPGRAPTLVAHVLGLKIALAAVAAGGLVLVVRLENPDPDVRWACYLLGVSSIFRSYLLTVRHTLQGFERFGADGAIVLVDRALLLLFGVAALEGGFGLIGLASTFVAARVLSLSVAWLVLAGRIGRVRPAFDLSAWRALQFQALPFGAFSVVFLLYSYIDAVMLFVLRSDAETGLYSAAYRVYEGLSNVAQVLQAVLIPRLAAQFTTDAAAHGRLSRRGLAVAFGLAVPVGAGAIAAAGFLLPALFGAGYAASAPVLQVLAGGLVFVFPLFVLYAVALSADGGAWLLRTAAAGCLANVAMNAVLIPRHGMYGAAAATVAGEALCVAVLAWGLRRRIWPAAGSGGP